MLFFLFLVFVGLYFFGDFRLNDTNVKDYLQEKVTVEKIMKIKEAVTVAIQGKQKQSAPKPETKTQPKALEDAKTVFNGNPLDQISKKDRTELLKIINNNKDK